MISEKIYNRALFGVVSLAFLLRFTGIQYGLPAVYHQDEPIIVNHALAVGVSGWKTSFFIIPPFLTYFLFMIYALMYVAGHLLGIFANTEAFGLLFLKDPSWFYLAGRIFAGVLFGVATVYMAARVSRKPLGEAGSLAAAFWLAIAPIHVQHSHYIYADIALTFAVLCLYAAGTTLIEKPTSACFALLGVLLGWAVSIKYTAVFFAPALLLSYALIFKREAAKPALLSKLILAAAASLITFALIAPYTFLDWTEFSSQLLNQNKDQLSAGWVGDSRPWQHWLTYAIVPGTSSVLVLLAFFGAVSLWIRDRKLFYLFIPAMIVFYLLNVRFGQPFARYMLPLIPFVVIFAAEGWLFIAERYLRSKLIKQVLFLLIAAPLTLTSLYSDALFLKKDTRDEAYAWFRQNVRPGSVVVTDNRFFSPPLEPTKEQIKDKYGYLGQSGKDVVRKKRLDLELRALDAGAGYNVYVFTELPESAQTDFLFLRPMVYADLKSVQEIKAEFVILNYTDYHSKAHEVVERNKTAFERVAAFSPFFDASQRVPGDPYATTAAPHLPGDLFQRKSLGPYIEIYRVRRP